MSQPAPVAADRLNRVYRTQRLRISQTVTAAVAAAWAALHAERDATIAQVVQIVTAGQSATVQLVNAYMAARALHVTGETASQALDPADYTIDKIRRLPAAVVYSRPFGAYGAFRAKGADPARALEAAQVSVVKLARTDLQLAQTHAARDWMADDPKIYGWRRVLNGDKNCPLCTLAATRIYYRGDLMPIHENCDCTVEPLYGEHPGGLTVPADVVRVAHDQEIGPRLLADGWAV